MPNWKKVVVSGSAANLHSLNVSTDVAASNISSSGNIFGNLSENSSIEIHNILGQLVHKEFLNRQTITKEFNLRHFKKGIYTVSLNLKGKTAQTQKIIIN